MLFSFEWLRALCPVEDGADAIARGLTARGLTVDGVGAAGTDHVLDVDVPANRPDCLGHLGLAREISAATGVPLASRPETADADRAAGDVTKLVRVEIEDPALCARYTARVVRGVRIAPSPAWVVRRLEACGLRSINNVVDASNLVMLELGNPIHFFDLDRIGGATINVRLARTGEKLTTLDGVERSLAPDMLLIADADRPVALAGVMGGADSEIGISTRDVLVEAAWFAPRSVRSTARRLGLRTDAGHRFERGVDREGVVAAQDLAAELLARLAGGVPVPGMVDAYPGSVPTRRLTLRLATLPRLLGYEPDETETVAALQALRLEPQARGDRVEVSVPSWRVDLEREVDLVEEVARHLGYDRSPTHTTGLPGVLPVETPARPERRAREILSALGFHEALGYAMIGAGEDDAFVHDRTEPALKLTNPIAETLAVLRRSILPGLLRAVDLNLRRGVRDVRLFEVGHVFLGRREGGFPDESSRVGVAWTGSARPRHWSVPDREADLGDLAGLVERLLSSLGGAGRTSSGPLEMPGFEPGRALRWRDPESGRELAVAGLCRPGPGFDRSEPVLLAEIDLGAFTGLPRAVARFRPLPRLTAATRDLALVLGPETSWAEVMATLSGVDAPAEVQFEPIDRYEGAPLPPGRASLTVRVTLAPSARALTEDEIDGFRRALIRALRENLGVGVRGEGDD